MVNIKILTGSVRPTRFNIQPATWLFDLASERADMDVELLDLAEINLPFLDEPKSPSKGEYEKDYTKKWSQTIDGADGFVFVTPEYNHSYSPVLKNALDFLYREWSYKPVTFVSYGNVGGARAIEHLRGVAGELKMFDLRETVMFTAPWNNKDDEGQYQFSDTEAQKAHSMLDTLAFWGETMKSARAELA